MTRKKSSQSARFRRLLVASLLPTMLFITGCAKDDDKSSSTDNTTTVTDNTTTVTDNTTTVTDNTTTVATIDALGDLISKLTTDLSASGDLTPQEVEAIVAAAKTEASNAGENNDLLTVIPEALIGAVTKIRADLSGVEETNSIKVVVKSLMSNVSGASSLANSRSARVAAIGDKQNFPALLQALGRAVTTVSSGYSSYLELLSEAVVSNLSETGATASEIVSNNYIGIFANEAAAESQRKGYDKTTATTLVSGLSTGVILGINSLSDLTTEQKNTQTSNVRSSMLNVASSNGLYVSDIEKSISNAAVKAGLDDGSTSSTTAGTVDTGTADTGTSSVHYTLQLLHFSDVNGNEQSAIDSVDEFSALAQAFRSDTSYGGNTLFVGSGGHLDPQAVRFTATDNGTVYNSVLSKNYGSADMALLNALAVDAVNLSPNEFTSGLTVLKNAIQNGIDDNVTAKFPHLVSNITLDDGVATGAGFQVGNNSIVYANQLHGKLAKHAVVSVGGNLIGLIGVASPDIDNVSNTGSLVITPDNDTAPATASDLASTLQPTVNVLRAAQVNKIVLLSHLQDIGLEKSLAGKLYDVDIIVAGGSRTRMGDSNDALFSGTHVTDSGFDDNYPYQTVDLENNPVLVVNVDGDYKYLGRLVVGFDRDGVIQTSSLDSAVNGAYAATSTVVNSVGGAASSSVTSLQTPIKAVVDAAYDNTTSNTVGYDNITLSGSTFQLRTQDTQLGNLIAKANRWYADNLTGGVSSITINASFREARGIRNGLEVGPVTEADIKSVLPDNNSLAVLQITATELVSVLEHSVALSSSTATPPRFLQVSGLRFNYNLDNQSRTVLDNGTVTDNGSRITKIELMYDNGTLRNTLFDNGSLSVAGGTNYRIVTTAFLANGGDLYPLNNLDNASRIDLDNGSYSSDNGSSFSGVGTEQDALAEYFKAFHDNETVGVTADSLDNYTRITAE